MFNDVMSKIFGSRWKGFGDYPDYVAPGVNTQDNAQQTNEMIPTGTPLPQVTNNPYKEEIANLEKRYGIPPGILAALIHTESGFNPKAQNINKREKSYGLGQINILAHKISKSQALNPSFALNFAAERLSKMIKKYGLHRGIQAYNTPGAVGSKQLTEYANKILNKAGYNIEVGENAVQKGQPKSNKQSLLFKNNTETAFMNLPYKKPKKATYSEFSEKFQNLGNVTSNFGEKTETETAHGGVDFANKPGTRIPSFASGVVKATTPYISSRDNGLGKQAVVQDNRGSQHIYSHLGDVFVKPGQVVNKGQTVGTMGSTGNSYSNTGNRAHLDYRIASAFNKYINPLSNKLS